MAEIIVTRINNLIDEVLDIERGYVDHPDDRGGPTNWGVTWKVWLNWQIRNMPKSMAREIFKEEYWIEPKLFMLTEDIAPLVFDMAVNHGPYKAVTALQKVLRVKRDGDIGSKTMKAVRMYGSRLNDDLVDERVKIYKRIVKNNPTQKRFINGWLKRAESFRRDKDG